MSNTLLMSPEALVDNAVMKTVFDSIMERLGFYRNGEPAEGVLSAERIAEGYDIERSSRYRPIVDPARLNATAIFEVAGSPCIYFTCLDEDEPDVHRLSFLHSVAWNHGLAPLLWVVTPSMVRIYSCYSRPQSETDHDKHLIEFFENTASGLEKLNDFAGRMQIESGVFWTHDQVRRLVDRRQRVDAALLGDLAATTKLLTISKSSGDTNSTLPHAVAHRLLGRCIFSAYLQDRSIVSEEFLRSEFGVSDWKALLNSTDDTYKFFGWIRTTFNGDLFPLQVGKFFEPDMVTKAHLTIINSFLNGWDMQTGQGRLWPYRFDVLPVELISSIYEMFAHSSDSTAARQTSTHYTPLNLVDLVLGQLFPRLSATANILDLSCGSGVFLVESLRRLVAKRAASGEPITRAMIRDTMYQQIYGVDISPEAIQIAAFSLYLTALELDPDPQPLGELKFQQLIGSNLFADDAFNLKASFNSQPPFRTRYFDAVVGNPPWKKRSKNKSHVAYCKNQPKPYPLSFESPDQAFLYRAGDFVRDGGRIGMIVHSKPFFSQASSGLIAKESLLTKYRPDVLINLSSFRQQKLFPTATAPATIIILTAQRTESHDTMSVVSPECSADFARHGIIEIKADNIKRIKAVEIATDRDALKVLCWGSARDLHLIRRLRNSFAPLSFLTGKSTQSRWFAGQGYKEVSENAASDETSKAAKNVDLSGLQGKPCLTSGQMTRFEVAPELLPPFAIERFYMNTDQRIFKGPLTIVRRAVSNKLVEAAFVPSDTVYDSLYYGIAFPTSDEWWAHVLNGVFNSSLAAYFLFMTASVWGIERDEIQPSDLERLPIPLPIGTNTPDKGTFESAELRSATAAVVAAEQALRQSAQRNNKVLANPSTAQDNSLLQKALDHAVFDLYGLDEDEQTIVTESVTTTIDVRMRGSRSPALEKPLLSELRTYAESVINVMSPWLETLGENVAIADVLDVGDAALCVVRFAMPFRGDVPPSREGPIVVRKEPLGTVLDRIASLLSTSIEPQIAVSRNLRIYVGSSLYVVKPSQRRYWTKYAGLNDGDGIMKEHMRAQYDESPA